MTPDLLLYGTVVFLPFILQALIVCLSHWFQLQYESLLGLRNPGYQAFTICAFSTTAGFGLLVRKLRWYSLLVGIVYYPAFIVVLFYFTFVFSAAVFGGP